MTVPVNLVPKIGVYLYLFCSYGREHEPLRPLKIGITSNVASRLTGVQTGCAARLHALAVFGIPNRDIAREREAAFHRDFAASRLEGEWFDVDPISALELICTHWRYYLQKLPDCIEVMGIPHYEREIKVLRAWRQYYAETSNVQAIA